MEPIYSAKWISAPSETGDKVWEYKRDFAVSGKIEGAVLYSSAIGVYTAELNGNEAGVYRLAPGWTQYERRVQYQKTDVTALIKSGANVLKIRVGKGFLCQDTTHCDNPPENLPGLSPSSTAIIAALKITYEGGSEETVLSSGEWTVSETEWRYSDMYNGDVYDATFETNKIFPARVLDAKTDTLIPQEGETVSCHEVLPVKEIIYTPRGETVLDFGQNLTGFVRMRVRGERGGVCHLTFGEVLDKDGNFYRENYRKARAETEYICDGRERVFEPLFTFYGFRYVRVDKWSGEFCAEDFSAVAVHSDMERIGHFECSDEGLSKLYHNIIWGQKGNFLDVPTDCPQRDERMGWTGDAQVFSGCAALNFNVLKFFKKWLGDMRICQKEDGHIPVVVPSHWWRSAAAWSDACVIIPYNLYMYYGDKSVLTENYDMMRRWVEYLESDYESYTSPEREHYGDWLALEREDSCAGLTPKEFIAAAYVARSTELFIKISKALGKECEKYRDFYAFCRDDIRARFSDVEKYEEDHGGDPSLKTQTYYALRLCFGLYDGENERRALADKLCDLVLSCGHLKTGFVGTPCLLYALSENGHADVAYTLLLRKEYPSWLYPISRGATTMWEHWDGIKENGDFWSRDMNSFNHYAYGAVGEWMYTVMAGITPASPGFEKVVFAPVTDARVERVKASVKTRFGVLRSEWKTDGDRTEYRFTVPTGAKATARLSGKEYPLAAGENVIVI